MTVILLAVQILLENGNDLRESLTTDSPRGGERNRKVTGSGPRCFPLCHRMSGDDPEPGLDQCENLQSTHVLRPGSP